MIARFENENQIKLFPGWYREDGRIYTNEKAEKKALASGEWFEVTEDEKPEVTKNQYIVPYYELADGKIHKKWDIKEVFYNEFEVQENEDIEEADTV